MMTKTTLKALWFGGGGLIATWLAVTPGQNAPAAATASAVQRSTAASELTAEDLRVQADRLRHRVNAAAARQTQRNPFRFNTPKPAASTMSAAVPPMPPSMAAPVAAALSAPRLKLDGIAEKNTPVGPSRTAIISGEGQMYLVRAGDVFAGRFTVVSVDSEAVLLRDAIGVELQLTLPSR